MDDTDREAVGSRAVSKRPRRESQGVPEGLGNGVESEDDGARSQPANNKRARTTGNASPSHNDSVAPAKDDTSGLLPLEGETEMSRSCPYLGTISRHVLDFDFQKLCSVTLSNQRPYGCLVCGKFFQGRGKNTHAMIHALEERHYLFINLTDTTIWCLPDNYQVIDASLNDIKYHLDPTYTKDEVDKMSSTPRFGKALDGTDFIPGCLGLNNLKKTEYFNVVIQALCTVIPLRNAMLLHDTSHKQAPDPVLKTLGELMRKIFNPRNFKGIVSPHEFLQAVGVASQKRFAIGSSNDPLALLAWLFKRLHMKMRDKKTDKSAIHDCFQGKLRCSVSQVYGTEETAVETQLVPFLLLSLRIPAAPVFKDTLERSVIPQMSIMEALQKYDGVTPEEVAPGKLQRYALWELPPYLVVHINRFSRNNFFVEKNPTIVTFPFKNFDLKDYIDPQNLHANRVTRYDLVANIVHEGKPQDGSYKCQVYHAPTSEWYEIEDLRVTPTIPQMVALSESYVQVYQRQDVQPDGSIDKNHAEKQAALTAHR